MKDLKPIRGRSHILSLIAEGEHQQQDFKYAISDARKIARSISAFANRDGGHLLVGVKDNGVIAGVRNEEDIYVIEQAAEMYCSPPQHVEFTAYSTGDPGIVIKASIAKSMERPVRAQEPDKRWRAYYRVADENIVAHPLMVKAWKRQASPHSASFVLGGLESEILSTVKERGSIEIEEALRICDATRLRAENAIAALAALGLVEFAYSHPRFLLALPSE